MQLEYDFDDFTFRFNLRLPRNAAGYQLSPLSLSKKLREGDSFIWYVVEVTAYQVLSLTLI